MCVKWKTGTNLPTPVSMTALVWLVFVSYANADDLDVSFPYQAIVLKDSAQVHSGPGSVHYATDRLAQGATVEVHRHDPGGWCAVRPVRGSFSLVPSAAVEIVDDQIGHIIEAGTQAWVGTRLGSVEKPLWQVKLREGERVEILGEVSWPHPEGHSTIWYQIAPPAGEFRWMKISDLQLPPSTRLPNVNVRATNGIAANNQTASPSHVRSLVDVPAAQNGSTTQAQPIGTASTTTILSQVSGPQPLTSHATQPAEPAAIQLASATQEDGLNLGWRRSTRPIPNTETGFDRSSVAAAVSPVATQPVRVASNLPAPGLSPTDLGHVPDRQNYAMTRIQSRPPANRYASLPNVTNYNQVQAAMPTTNTLQNLELRLTNEMLKDPTRWQIESILSGAQQVHGSARSANEQLRATRLIEKCRNCLQVQAGFTNGRPVSGSGRSTFLAAGAVGSGILSADQDVSFGATYDAFGWLNELVRKQGELDPEYVLQNRDGKITHHVIASPGLNLRRYLKSKVGIIGQRGYNHALNLDHVVADRVVVLDQAR